MPGWHEATKPLQDDGKIRMVGIIQEQHPERTRLFMQWKQMDWPILVDPLNLLKVPVVPITLAIDEYGIIRKIKPSLKDAKRFLTEFVHTTYKKPICDNQVKAGKPDINNLEANLKSGTAESWQKYGDALALWSNQKHREAIHAYQKGLEVEPGNANINFRLGVAYRMRYDSENRQAGDFGNAVKYWSKALKIDPNNYIWRRRIQQYGPRLDKPYPFYDWIHVARKKIQARGEIPFPLNVEPGGAEFVSPVKEFKGSGISESEPDPKGLVYRDEKRFISSEVTIVPPEMKSGAVARVHVVLRPHQDIKAHWNNEVEDMVFWVNPPEGWHIDRALFTVPSPSFALSREIRKIEFEIQCPDKVDAGFVFFNGYALYYVCEDVDGACLYRRQDVSFQIRIVE